MIYSSLQQYLCFTRFQLSMQSLCFELLYSRSCPILLKIYQFYFSFYSRRERYRAKCKHKHAYDLVELKNIVTQQVHSVSVVPESIHAFQSCSLKLTSLNQWHISLYNSLDGAQFFAVENSVPTLSVFHSFRKVKTREVPI